MNPIQASCRCGEVTLTISAEPVAQFFCHCRDCQMAHSGAYVAASMHPAAAVVASGGELSTRVMRTTRRMQCAHCGTPLFAELDSFGIRSVNAYLLPEAAFQPQFHVQCQDAVRPVVDGLPHYRVFPARFGGSDDCMEW